MLISVLWQGDSIGNTVKEKSSVLSLILNTLVAIRLHPHFAIPPPLSRSIGWIACTQKFSEYYSCLPGITNDPFCCMTLLVIEWSPLQRRLPMLLNGQENPRKLPLPIGGSAPPSNTWFCGPTRVFIQNDMSISSVVFAQHTVMSHYFTMGRYVFPKNCPFPLGDRVPIQHMHMATRAHLIINPKGIWIGSAVFVWVPNAMLLYNALWMGKTQHCPFPLGLRHPAGGRPSHGVRQHVCLFGRYARRQTDWHRHTDKHTRSRRQSNNTKRNVQYSKMAVLEATVFHYCRHLELIITTSTIYLIKEIYI